MEQSNVHVNRSCARLSRPAGCLSRARRRGRSFRRPLGPHAPQRHLQETPRPLASAPSCLTTGAALCGARAPPRRLTHQTQCRAQACQHLPAKTLSLRQCKTWAVAHGQASRKGALDLPAPPVKRTACSTPQHSSPLRRLRLQVATPGRLRLPPGPLFAADSIALHIMLLPSAGCALCHGISFPCIAACSGKRACPCPCVGLCHALARTHQGVCCACLVTRALRATGHALTVAHTHSGVL